MPVNSVFAPFQYFTDATGAALENGFVYIGIPGGEARSNPKASFFNVGLTIPTGTASGAAVRTRAGLPINNSGAPATIYVEDDYSMTVTDRNGVVVYSTLNATLAINVGGSSAPVRWADGTLGSVGGGFAAEPATGFIRPSGNLMQSVVGGFVATEATTGTFKSSVPFLRQVSATVTAGADAQGSPQLSSDFSVITTAAANPSGITLPFAQAGRRLAVVNRGANPVNVYPDFGDKIGTLGIDLPWLLLPGASIGLIARDSTNWEVLGERLVSNSGAITLSGATTNISTNLNIFNPTRITVWMRAVSLDAAGYGGLQLGSGGAFTTSGYVRCVSSNRTADVSSTSQFVDIGSNNVGTTNWEARYDLRLVLGAELWQCNITGASSAGFSFSGSGTILLAGPVDRIRAVTTAGNFDNGTVLAEWS
jgi:hypothetical protein